MQGSPLEVAIRLHLVAACVRPRHADRVVVVDRGDTARERADHRLSVQAASVGPDQHLCFRALLLDRMWVIYRALQQLVATRLELS